MRLKQTTASALFVFLTLSSCQESKLDSVTFKAATHHCNEQIVQKKSLIVVEYASRDEKKGGNDNYLTRYNFQTGQLVSKDTILGAPALRNDSTNNRMNFYWGSDFYKNRYVISSNGSVIDLDTKSFICVEGDEFIRAHGDSLIFFRDTIDHLDNERSRIHKQKGTGYWICDLQTKKYELAKPQNGMALQGLLSPDLKHGLEVDMANRRLKPFTKPFKIILHDAQQNTKNIVVDCGFGTPQARISSHESNVPIYWIDNKHFIYGKYFTPILSLFFKTTSRVEIRLVNIETGDDTLIGNIKSIPATVGASNFSQNQAGKLVFECHNGSFVIDLPTKKITLDTARQLGHQFQANFNRHQASEILFKNERIGKIWGTGITTTCGYFAAEYGEVGSNLGEPKGIKIWNQYTREWTTIDIPHVETIIGWK